MKFPRDDGALKELSREWWRVVLRAVLGVRAVDFPAGDDLPVRGLGVLERARAALLGTPGSPE